MFAKSKRGFGADGRIPTLLAVVNHYDSCFKLGPNASAKSCTSPFEEKLLRDSLDAPHSQQRFSTFESGGFEQERASVR